MLTYFIIMAWGLCDRVRGNVIDFDVDSVPLFDESGQDDSKPFHAIQLRSHGSVTL